jgi:hypothetical protein
MIDVKVVFIMFAHFERKTRYALPAKIQGKARAENK